MHRIWFALLLMAWAVPSLSRAQFGSGDASWGPSPLQKFEATGTQTTAAFQVPNGWKLRYHSFHPVKITLYSSDGKLVMGTAVAGMGALYFPTGGTYYLKIEGAQPFQPTPAPNPAPAQSQSSGLVDTITEGTTPNPTNSDPNGNQNHPPVAPNNGANITLPMFQWTVAIYDASTPASTTASAFDYNVPSNSGPGSLTSAPSPVGNPVTPQLPSPAPPAVTATPAPAAAPTPALKLTEDQTRAIVLIQGDNAEGTGFLVKMPDGPAVVTNLHVIGNNPNIKITTSNGNVISMISAKGASDRDLALLMIKDQGYSYLDLATDMSTSVQTGDDVITPGNSQGGGVVLSTDGKILGIGPDRIEFDNPIYHGNSGGPVFDPKTNKVLGVVTMAIKVDHDNDLDKASFASRNSAITKDMRYFGLRLDTVPSWVPLDWRQFQIETTFLDQFHDESCNLDSFLNASKNTDGSTASSSEDSRPYLNDKKIMSARDDFIKQSSGTDGAQRVQAFRELLYDLTGIADADLASAQEKNNFYSFDQERAKEEAAYRKALKDEIDSIGDDVSRLNGLASRSDNNNTNSNNNNGN